MLMTTLTCRYEVFTNEDDMEELGDLIGAVIETIIIFAIVTGVCSLVILVVH